MPAKIRITSGHLEGKDFPITEVVSRVGSDPDSSICLPVAELEDHSFTLEFRDGVYIAYNRSENAIQVDEELIAPDGHTHWRANTELRLVDGTGMRLIIEGDPKPGSKVPPVAATLSGQQTEFSERDEDAIGGKKQPSKTLQGVVFLALVMLLGLPTIMLIANLSDSGGGSGETSVDFNQLIKTSLESNAIPPRIRNKLQVAHILEIRGQGLNARETYRELMELTDDLFRPIAGPESERGEREELLIQIRQYVTSRLATMKRG